MWDLSYPVVAGDIFGQSVSLDIEYFKSASYIVAALLLFAIGWGLTERASRSKATMALVIATLLLVMGLAILQQARSLKFFPLPARMKAQ